MADRWPPFLLAGLVIGLWSGLAWSEFVDPIIVPAPTAVLAVATTQWPMLLDAAIVTLQVALAGLFVGGMVGTAIALGLEWRPNWQIPAESTLVALRMTPLVAIAPVLFVWFGDGPITRVGLVATLTVFPVAIATASGLRATPAPMLDIATSVGASRRTTLWYLKLPSARRSILTGWQIAGALSVTGTIVTEFLSLDAGLGAVVLRASNRLDTPMVFLTLAIIALVGLGLYYLPAGYTRLRW